MIIVDKTTVGPKLIKTNGGKMIAFSFKNWIEENGIDLNNYSETVGLSKATIHRRMFKNRSPNCEVVALLRIISKLSKRTILSECFSGSSV